MHQNVCRKTNFPVLSVLRRIPDAVADIEGSADHPCISGAVRFYQTRSGVLIFAEITGLPDSGPDRIFGFHIHEGSSCTGDRNDPFSDALTHYNPEGRMHPYHAGDLPPLFGSNGFALSLFLTDRFCVREVTGRVVIIHDRPDDFVTQPSGNSGKKIACGTIRATI